MSLAEDLDMLGAEGLSGQYVTVRIRSIDKAKLSQALGGTAGAAVPAALTVVDFAPQQALSLAMPMVVEKVKGKYGVDLEYQITEAPPKPGEKPPSKMGKGLLLGAALGAGGAWAASHFGLLDGVRGAVGRIF